MVRQVWLDGSSGEDEGEGEGHDIGGRDGDMDTARDVRPDAGRADEGVRGVGRRRFVVGAGLAGTGALLGAAGTAPAAAAPAAPAAPAAATPAAATGHAGHAGHDEHDEHDAQASFGPKDFRARRLLLVPDVVLLPEGPVKDRAVLVEDGTFRAVGPVGKLTQAHRDAHTVRLKGHLLMPGFVDAHHHLTQSFGKAQAFGQPSEIFKTVWEPLEHALDEETAHLSAKLAALEALRGGFTTAADAGTRAPVDVGVIAKAAEEAGLRCVLSKVVSDGKGGKEHLERFQSSRLIHPSLAIPVPEDATAEVLKKTADLCEEADAVLQVHVNEHLASVERSLKSVGRRPVSYLHHIGALNAHTLGSHATLLTPDEMRMLADTGAAVSYNPVASAWKGNAVAHALMWQAMGIRFGTGTDGTRGGGFRLVDAAESAQRLTYGMHSGDSSCGAGRTWLTHATALSADAVGLGKVTGEIAVGKAADFLLVDLQVPELTPSYDLSWELVRLADRDQISAVFVDGKLRLWDGWPTDWDGRALVRKAAEVGPKVVERARIQRVDPDPDGTARHARRARS
ncbi:amidohydrolase family protein [Streptomyces atriruber]|uniref:Amidohydrolase family protein n=1 Tax=Streptomyces atriruber TaxID=545121 RepID=A0ABV3BDD5_9ACTN